MKRIVILSLCVLLLLCALSGKGETAAFSPELQESKASSQHSHTIFCTLPFINACPEKTAAGPQELMETIDRRIQGLLHCLEESALWLRSTIHSLDAEK